MKEQNTILFSDEITHLNQTLQIIDTALTEAREDVLRLDKEYRDAKKYMADYRNEMDSHEKLQNERLLEQTDRTGVFAVEVREKIEKLKESPYFARIDFVCDGDEEAETFYIGRFGFTHHNKKLIFDRFVALNKSYRSTYEIMEYAKKICNQPFLEMVERHGERVQNIYCESVDSEIASMENLITKFEKGKNASLGIVTKTGADAKRLYDVLSREHKVHLLTQDSTSFTNGVSITPIGMAKGLEFDEVIVPDADNRNFGSDYDRNLLYVACTRAMHKLTLFYTGSPSPFIPEF